MNCLYITLFFNIVAGNVQTFIKLWNQLLHPQVIEVCHQPFEPHHDFFLHLIIVHELFPSLLGFMSVVKNPCFISSHNGVQKLISFLRVHFLHRENVWRNATCIWQDFGSALPFQTCLTQTKPVLPLPNEHGSQVKDQAWQQCCHNKHKKFSYRPTRDVSLLSGHTLYIISLYMVWGSNGSEYSDCTFLAVTPCSLIKGYWCSEECTAFIFRVTVRVHGAIQWAEATPWYTE